MNRRSFMKSTAAGLGTALALRPGILAANDGAEPGLRFWIETSLRRVFPAAPAGETRALGIVAARGERLSFQACVRNNTTAGIAVRATAEADGGLAVRVRRVGCVPVPHHTPGTEEAELDGFGRIPGPVPDPLFPEDSAWLPAFQAAAFWITVDVPPDAEPGARDVRVTFRTGDEVRDKLAATFDVRPLRVGPRKDFPVTHWWTVNSLWDRYGVEPWSDAFFAIAAKYLANLRTHGTDVCFVPLVHVRSHEVVKRPAQTLRAVRGTDGGWTFDFDRTRRWVREGKAAGFGTFEWPHLATPAPISARDAMRIYDASETPARLLWPAETPATSDLYRDYLTAFLPAFRSFLDSEGILDRSIYHLADEADGAEALGRYRELKKLVQGLAPWMKFHDALSDVNAAREKVVDMPIPNIMTAPDYQAAGYDCWVYYCGGPTGAYLNRFLDTPLAKLRAAGWLFRRHRARGFLHWAYLYWYHVIDWERLIDPFQATDGGVGWPCGDTTIVYPGPDGPLDSQRWEVFAESLQDYALLEAAEVGPDDPRLAELKSYYDFPKTPEWVEGVRRRILGA